MKRSFLFIPLLIFILFLSLGAISANDVGDNLTDTPIIEDSSSNDIELNTSNIEENTVINNEESNILEDDDESDTIYVSCDGDDLNNGTKNSPIKTLNVAISKNHEAGGGKTIFLSNGNYTAANLNISDKVNIVGQTSDKVILDANFKGYVFTSSANVNIANLTFKNAFNAIINNGNMVIETSSFINNIASVYGGAIDNNGNLVIRKSTFINNTAKSNGGAIDNSATLTVNDCLFINNTADNDAGAISSINDYYTAIATITNSTFINNSAVRNGGAIKAQTSQLFVYNSSFDDNSLKGYYDGSRGGAIYGWTAGVTLYNTSFTNNKILYNGMGGALYVNGGNYYTVSFNGSGLNLINNSANYGGACYFASAYGNLTNSIILNNTMQAVYGSSTYTNINLNNNWWGNTQSSTGFNSTLVGGLTAPSEWLILSLDANTGNLTVGDSVEITIDLTKTQKGNTVNFSSNLPIISLKSTNGIVNTSNIDLINGKGSITYTAESSGIGEVIANLYGVEDSITFDIAPLLNVIYVDVANGNDNYAGTSWNNAVKTLKHALTLDSNIIYIAQGTYEEYGLAISKNISLIGFGEVIIDGKNTNSLFSISESNLDVTFKNINFVNGKSTTNGAAISIENNVNVLVDNCTFKNNYVSNSEGGAIGAQGGILNITHSVFINNTASKGSAIFVSGLVTKADINYCVFEGYDNTTSVIENSVNKLTINANYNYFGNNSNPANLISDNVNATYWTILNVTPNVDRIIATKTIKLNIDFTKYSDGTNVYTLKESMPTLVVSLKATIGTITPVTVICENGIASVNYTSSLEGMESISINAPYYVGNITFNVLNKDVDVIYVSPDGDDSKNGTSEAPLKTIAAAIAKNHELGGDKTICLLDGIYTASGLNINDNVTIIGKNIGKVIINGNSNNYIINSTAKLIIEDLTFIKADKAIINSGELSIETSTFSNDKKAIFSTAGSVTVSNSKFIDNGLGISIENTTLSLNNNIMKDNTVNVNFISGSILSKIQVVFLNNSTLRQLGTQSFVIGATVCDDKDNVISGGNITFTANGIPIGTGNIVNGTANATINGMDDGTYIISGTSSLGDKLVIKTGTLNVYSDHWFIGNVGYETLADAVEAANNGDVIEGLPGVYKYTKPVEILKNITIKNKNQGEIILDGSLVTGNYIVYPTGAIEYLNNILRIPYENVTIDLYNLTFTNVNNQGHGGAIYNHGNLSIYNCTFVNNTVVKNLDDEYNYGGAAIFSYNAHLVIRDSYFVNNSAYEGGAIYAAADSGVNSTLDINNTIFKDNLAVTYNEGGGAIYSGNYLKLLVNNTEFINNSAPTKHPNYIGGGHGGAVYIRLSTGSLITNSRFVNNSAFYHGGAIKSYSAEYDVTNCNFTSNYAGSGGGALHFAGSGSTLALPVSTIDNCTFNNNDVGVTMSAGGSMYRGGAICVEGAIKIYNSKFNENTAVDGGAIYAGYVTNEIANCTFIDNNATNGGAIYNYIDSINVTNSYFKGNTATYGGAIANYQDSTYVNLLNNTYVENSAVYGGAIYSYKSIFVEQTNILYSEFVNNSASANGNEVYITGNTNINYNSFLANIGDVWVNTTSADMVSIENNWWGTSSPNWNEILTNIDVPKVYAVLNATLKESGSRTYDLIIDMYWNGTSSQVNISNIPARTVKLNATGGLFNVNESKFSDGEVSTIFNQELKEFSVTATVDNELIEFNISTFYPTSVNVSVNKGDDLRDNIISVVVNPTKASGNITINVDGEDHVVDLVNGQANLTVSNLTLGEHTVNVTYNGDEDYSSSNTVIIFNETFSPIVNLTLANVVKYFGGSERLVAILKDNLGNPLANETIIFNINGNKYTKTTDTNGSVSMAINLNPGTYNVSASFNGTKLYDSTIANTTVTVKSTIIGQNIVKMFRNGTQYYCLFLDSEGNPLVNVSVKFNINGVMYERQTNESGIARLNINLNPGDYIITNYNTVTGEENSNNITVKSLIEDNYNLVKYYKNDSKYTVKVYDKEGNVAANQELTFNINGVFYKRTADENGTVSLAINLRPGDYVVTAEYEGCKVSNNITVKPTLLTGDLSMTYKDGSKYDATVLDGQGKPLANQNVVFNVNGVFYNKITDSNGVASLNINLMKGEYIITSMWNGYQVGNDLIIK